MARVSLGLDKPLHEQYLSWMADVLRGDLGRSFWREEPIRVLIVRRAPITIEIATLAVLISWIIGIPVGVLSALKRESKLDHVMRVATTVFLAIPSFWLAMLILMFTVLNFLWRPPIEMVYLWENPSSNLQMVAGPAAVLGLGLAAIMARFSRSSMLEVLGQDYVRTAQAKGLLNRQVIWPHALKNAILPVITVTGGALGGLLGGAVAVETAFLVPGLGNALVVALAQRDWMVIQNLVLIYGVIHTLVNLIVDLSYRWIDPRIRYV
jgi:peptide/nickel transport system permease protein